MIIDKEEPGYRLPRHDALVPYKFLARYGKNSLKVIVATESRLSVSLISHHQDVDPSTSKLMQKHDPKCLQPDAYLLSANTTQNKFQENVSATIATTTMVKSVAKMRYSG